MRVARVLVPAAIAVALLAGCGGGDNGGTTSSSSAPPASTAPASNGVAELTPDEILAKAIEALEKAGSYQVSGKATEEGEVTSMDFKFANGSWGGTINMQGSGVELLVVENQTYFKADADFWKAMGGADGAGVAKLINDRWVKVSADDEMFGDMSEISGMADPKTLLQPDGTLAKGEAKELEAGPAIGLVDQKAKSTLYVATTGEPYPLLIESPDGDVTIGGFGESYPELVQPAEKDVVDFSELSGS